jgi:hypothetical protein
VEEILRESLKESLEESGLNEVLGYIRGVDGRDKLDEHVGVPSRNVFTWGGAFHSVPEGWKLPKVNVRVGWQLWSVGDGEIPPYRSLHKNDIQKSQQKPYSAWKCLMGRMEKYLLHLGRDLPRDAASASESYSLCKPFFQKHHPTPRFDHLHVCTLAKKFRRVNMESSS